jgi:hypothetical protein
MAITHSLEIDTPSGGITQGTVQQIGSVLGFAFKTSTITSTDYEDYAEESTMITNARQCKGVKASGGGSGSFQRGTLVYYDVSGQVVTSVSSGNVLCGYATAIATEADTEIEFDFDGNLAN